MAGYPWGFPIGWMADATAVVELDDITRDYLKRVQIKSESEYWIQSSSGTFVPSRGSPWESLDLDWQYATLHSGTIPGDTWIGGLPLIYLVSLARIVVKLGSGAPDVTLLPFIIYAPNVVENQAFLGFAIPLGQYSPEISGKSIGVDLLAQEAVDDEKDQYEDGAIKEAIMRRFERERAQDPAAGEGGLFDGMLSVIIADPSIQAALAYATTSDFAQICKDRHRMRTIIVQYLGHSDSETRPSRDDVIGKIAAYDQVGFLNIREEPYWQGEGDLDLDALLKTQPVIPSRLYGIEGTVDDDGIVVGLVRLPAKGNDSQVLMVATAYGSIAAVVPVGGNDKDWRRFAPRLAEMALAQQDNLAEYIFLANRSIGALLNSPIGPLLFPMRLDEGGLHLRRDARAIEAPLEVPSASSVMSSIEFGNDSDYDTASSPVQYVTQAPGSATRRPLEAGSQYSQSSQASDYQSAETGYDTGTTEEDTSLLRYPPTWIKRNGVWGPRSAVQSDNRSSDEQFENPYDNEPSDYESVATVEMSESPYLTGYESPDDFGASVNYETDADDEATPIPNLSPAQQPGFFANLVNRFR